MTAFTTRAAIGIVAAVILGACASTPAPTEAEGTPFYKPTRNIHLRSTFDSDPSTYLGRFIPKDTAPASLDETEAVRTRCSEFLAHKIVPSSQEVDEVLYVSDKAALSLGLPPIVPTLGAGVNLSKSHEREVRVKYKLSRMMQIDVADPAGLDRCCKTAPDQCTATVIGTFLEGTGEIYEADEKKDGVSANAGYQGATVGGENSSTQGWKRVNSFKDQYFAFLATGVLLGEKSNAGPKVASDDACEFCDTIPTSLDGVYFCGVSKQSPSEADARDQAMRSAREQAVRYLTTYVGTAPSVDSAAVESLMADPKVVAAGVSGVAAKVKDQKWCKPKSTPGPEGVMIEAKVLAFLPERDRDEGARATMEALLDAGKKEGTVSPAQETEIKKAIERIGRSK